MSNSTLLTDYLGRGVAAARPSSITIAAGALALWFSTDTGEIDYWNGSAFAKLLPLSLLKVPIPFSFSGKPGAAQQIHVALITDVGLTIPAGFTGTVGYVGTNPTSTATFTLSKVNGGSATTIGTVAISTSGVLTLTAASPYTSAAGDTLRLAAPGSQDATLADVCLTFEAART